GGVFAYGRASFAGSVGGAVPLNAPMVAMAATPSGGGYWLAGRDGGVFALGDAGFRGGAEGLADGDRVADIAAAPGGGGYWLATDRGSVQARGDVPVLGDLAGAPLNAPVTAIVATPTGQGYWLVARDGGVFAFGDATWVGGAAEVALNRPVVDMAATPSGRGYWLVAADGGVFAFGDAGFYGGALGAVTGSVVAISTTHTGRGYWLASSKGGVYAFGDAGFYGAAADADLQAPVVGMAAGLGTAVPVGDQRLANRFGWDISWPQCGGRYPATGHGYAIVGVTDGHAFSVNPCLQEQHRWSRRQGSLAGLYVNVNYPSRAVEPLLGLAMGDACSLDDLGCQLYQWGARGAAEAFAAADALGVTTPHWWLDVETANRWSPDTAANSRIIQGAIDTMRARGVDVGIYSTPYQWGVIAGGFSPGLPVWLAGPNNLEEASATCAQGTSFGGGVTWMVQFPYGGFDGNLLCDPGVSTALGAFRLPPRPAVPVLDATELAALAAGTRLGASSPPPAPPQCGRWGSSHPCRSYALGSADVRPGEARG
ncbi:MAG: hypothetical protein ACRDZW_00860, partial [Acidimicrobiales bacterium]